jgi:hypothetical protein
MNIGIAGSAVNALGEIFHLPDRVAGKLTARTPDVVVFSLHAAGYEASTTIISSSGLRSAIANFFFRTTAAAHKGDEAFSRQGTLAV